MNETRSKAMESEKTIIFISWMRLLGIFCYTASVILALSAASGAMSFKSSARPPTRPASSHAHTMELHCTPLS